MSQRTRGAASPTRRRRFLATAVATAVAATTLATVAVAPASAEPVAGTVVAGEVDWGVKASFRSYIGGAIAHGSVDVRDGATTNADGTYRFPVATGEVTAGSVVVDTDGVVQFTGHSGLLDLTFSDIRIATDGDEGQLVADVMSKGLGSGDVETYDDVHFADLDLSEVTATTDDLTTTWAGVPATLTEDGEAAFADFYAAGTALDPVTIRAEVEETVVWEPAISVSQTSDLEPGDTVTVTGSGFDPTSNLGTRPPLRNEPAGVYVVFGRFADTWQPSQGAPSSARPVIDQRWAVTAGSRAIADPGGTNPQFIELTPDGTFTAELTVDVRPDTAGTYGVYTFPGSGAVDAAHELAQPVTFATPPPPAPRTPRESFVTAALTDFLGEADPAAVDAGVAALGGGTSRAAFLRQLTASDAWLGAVVDRLYLDTLGRPADATGRAHWVEELRSGRRTVAQAASLFYSSPEYFRRSGGTTPGWVDDLYVKILGRSADAAGRQTWVNHAQRHGRAWVAIRFYQSDESARTRVRALYETLLGRTAEPGGLAHWMPRVKAEGDLALATNLAASTEYANKAVTRFP